MKRSRLRRILGAVGPGFITGSADDDPSGIGTYAQTGAQFGYGQLWFALFITPFMIAIQEVCGRIGLVTGKGLSGVIRNHFSKTLLAIVVSLLFLANTINIGADLGAMAASAELLIGVPFVVWLTGMTVLIVALEIFVTYRTYAKILKYLTLSLLAYVLAAFSITQPWWEILKSTLLPSFSFSPDFLFNLLALFGTTISPYLFFWQAGEEVEEEVANHSLKDMCVGRPHVTRAIVGKMRLDTAFGMVFSNVMTFFIITTSASTLGASGIRSVATAAEAAEVLRPLAGPFTSLLFALGIIGTGLLAVPVLAGSASYAVAEAFGWKEGLYRKFGQARGFYGVIIIATFVGFMINMVDVPPFQMLYYTAVINGLAAPPLLIMIMLIGSRKSIMGNYVNSRLSNILGWTLTVAMTLVAAILLVTMLQS